MMKINNKSLIKLCLILLLIVSYFTTDKIIDIVDYMKLPKTVKQMDLIERDAFLYVHCYDEVLNIYGVAYADKHKLTYYKWFLDSNCLYLIFVNSDSGTYKYTTYYDAKVDLLGN